MTHEPFVCCAPPRYYQSRGAFFFSGTGDGSDLDDAPTSSRSLPARSLWEDAFELPGEILPQLAEVNPAPDLDHGIIGDISAP